MALQHIQAFGTVVLFPKPVSHCRMYHRTVAEKVKDIAQGLHGRAGIQTANLWIYSTKFYPLGHHSNPFVFLFIYIPALHQPPFHVSSIFDVSFIVHPVC